MAYAATLPPLTTQALLAGLLERDRIRAEYLRAVHPFAALISPPSSDIAFRHGEGGWGTSHPADYIRTMRHAQIANVLGLPAAVVPVCRSREGLPIGVQILGRPYEENALLDIAAGIDKRFGYQPPPLAKMHAATSR
jgi:Asp-tRNA(Asn)/Glu-tRNA(Gln) amidotransferase A subunit family amidase